MKYQVPWYRKWLDFNFFERWSLAKTAQVAQTALLSILQRSGNFSINSDICVVMFLICFLSVLRWWLFTSANLDAASNASEDGAKIPPFWAESAQGLPLPWSTHCFGHPRIFVQDWAPDSAHGSDRLYSRSEERAKDLWVTFSSTLLWRTFLFYSTKVTAQLHPIFFGKLMF